MKNFFNVLGTITLVLFGILYTNTVIDKIKDKDDIMVQIKAVSSHYEEKPEEAILVKNGIIPGISGKEVDIDESYKSMKKIGIFDPNLLKYKKVNPKKSIVNSFDKYIVSGNKNKEQISIIMLVQNNTKVEYIEKILTIAKAKNIKLNFFIDGNWFEKNNDILNKIALNNHEIGNLSYNGDYQDSSFIWMDTIIKKLNNKKYSYCYKERENKLHLETCALYKNYTIMPTKKIEKNFYENIKENINNGDFISVDVSNQNIEELPIVISYIQSKGLKIQTLSNLLKE